MRYKPKGLKKQPSNKESTMKKLVVLALVSFLASFGTQAVAADQPAPSNTGATGASGASNASVDSGTMGISRAAIAAGIGVVGAVAAIAMTGGSSDHSH